MPNKYLNEMGLAYLLEKIKNEFVEKEDNKGLSTNDFTNEYKEKLENIDSSLMYKYFEGKDLVLNNSVEAKIRDFQLEGVIEQNGVMPSTNYPSEVNGLGDNYNLLPIDKTIFPYTQNGVTFTYNELDDSIVANGTAINNTSYLTLISEENEYYLNEGAYRLSGCPSGGSENTYNIFLDTEDYGYSDYGDGINFNFQSRTLLYTIEIAIKANTVCNNLKFKPMLVKGTEDKPFLPYKKDIINVNNAKNKNKDYILDFTKAINVFNKDTMIELDGKYRDIYANGNISTNTYYYGIKVPVNGNTSYKAYGIHSYSNLCYYTSDMTYISGSSFDNGTYFTTPANCTYITLAVRKDGIDDFKILDDLVLYKGEIPYIENDKVYYNKKWKKVNLKASFIDTSNSKIKIYYANFITDYKRGYDHICYSNYFQGVPNGQQENQNYLDKYNSFICFRENPDYIRVYITTNEFQNAVQLNTFLTNNNVYIIYELESPVKTEIVGELATQIKNLYNSIQTYEDTTYIKLLSYGKMSGDYLGKVPIVWNVTEEQIKNLITIESVLPKNAGAHNSVYRGKDITELFYNGVLSQQIAAGTFDDVFVGDYIIGNVSGRKYLVADLDYYLQSGVSNHHIVLVPEKLMGLATMNDTNTTAGGYIGSKMHTTNLDPYRTIIQNDFGTNHILSNRLLLTNSASNGKANSWDFYETTVEIMSECMVIGHNSWGSHLGYETGNSKIQLALFRLEASQITAQNDSGVNSGYWLRDIASASLFVRVNIGNLGPIEASNIGGVRPAFLIK